jgi:hypothetical protein
MLQQRQIIANSNFAINLTILPDIQNESNQTNIKFLTYHGLAFIHGITDQYSVGADCFCPLLSYASKNQSE